VRLRSLIPALFALGAAVFATVAEATVPRTVFVEEFGFQT